MRDELMSEIIKLEWDMFSHVSNVGGPASCQMRPDTFKIMRKSQAAHGPMSCLPAIWKIRKPPRGKAETS